MSDSAYGNIDWITAYLDLPKPTFYNKRHALEAEGLPKKDPILGRWLKADVQAWVESRRTIKNQDMVTVDSHSSRGWNIDDL